MSVYKRGSSFKTQSPTNGKRAGGGLRSNNYSTYGTDVVVMRYFRKMTRKKTLLDQFFRILSKKKQTTPK